MTYTNMAKEIRKVTSKKVASAASKVLRDGRTSKNSKTAAWSALNQIKAPNKTISKKAASAASKVLKSKSTSRRSKSVGGSALGQRVNKKK